MLRPTLFTVAFAAAAVSYASAFQININATPLKAAASRRDVLTTTAACLSILLPLSPANADVIRSPGKCANGEGDGCDSLAEDNELIRSLQKKSSDNREANQRVGMNKRFLVLLGG